MRVNQAWAITTTTTTINPQTAYYIQRAIERKAQEMADRRTDDYIKRIKMLYEYMVREYARREDDVIGLGNNVQYRKADPVDHLEMIMAQARLGTVAKVFEDVQQILKGFR